MQLAQAAGFHDTESCADGEILPPFFALDADLRFPTLSL
jgi:hypothetical protein